MKIELRSCQLAIQAERGGVQLKSEEFYGYTRFGLILPGHQGHKGIPLNHIILPPIK